MLLTKIEIENFRCIKFLTWEVAKGLNILVGANDSGKTAIIDALHLTMGSIAQEYTTRLSIEDFLTNTSELRITCHFNELNANEKSRFAEYLHYDIDDNISLYLNLQAQITSSENLAIKSFCVSGKPHKLVNKTVDGVEYRAEGPLIENEVKEYFKAIYLRPLRDAEKELRAKRASRLSLILKTLLKRKNQTEQFRGKIKSFEVEVDKAFSDLTKKSDNNDSHGEILQHLLNMVFEDEKNATAIKLGVISGQEIQSMLERLDLGFCNSQQEGLIQRGLGYNNILYVATELSLLNPGAGILLIEEPEAHLHPQLQMRLIEYLESLDKQVVVTTHSPNLSSKAKLEHISIVKGGDIYSLKEVNTALTKEDRRFLERFLDVTKADLFFARGIILVEGPSEEILLPVIAKLLNKKLTAHGVTIINGGGKTSKRYANIFIRKDNKKLKIPVACIIDRDEIPNEMYALHPKYEKHGVGYSRLDQQFVKTFVSDYWTFEYDLLLGNGNGQSLALEIIEAMYRSQGQLPPAAAAKALATYKLICDCNLNEDGTVNYTEVACQLMYIFEENTDSGLFEIVKKSKAEMAQYLASVLEDKELLDLQERLPTYLINAIDYVTNTSLLDILVEEQPMFSE